MIHLPQTQYGPGSEPPAGLVTDQEMAYRAKPYGREETRHVQVTGEVDIGRVSVTAWTSLSGLLDHTAAPVSVRNAQMPAAAEMARHHRVQNREDSRQQPEPSDAGPQCQPTLA